MKLLERLFQHFENYEWYEWQGLYPIAQKALSREKNSKIPLWLDILKEIEEFEDHLFKVKDGCVFLGSKLEPKSCQKLYDLLFQFCPWRKGPFNIRGVHIDTEWRSDCKWSRLSPAITPLEGRKVLDVGCGNGYYLFRMIEEKASFVLGVEPFVLSVMQFWVLNSICSKDRAFILPLGVEQLPLNGYFDTVFSMGLLYHRKSPIDHLYSLFNQLRPGGELVLETLVVPGSDTTVLVPKERYAMMRNVWFIPSVSSLVGWIKRVGFENVNCVDVTLTTIFEQRSTEWMNYDSLEKFLDPSDHSLTIEGYPAPRRAIIIASRN